MNVKRYRKLVAVVVGLLATRYVPELLPFSAELTELVLMLLTAVSVYAVPNEQ